MMRTWFAQAARDVLLSILLTSAHGLAISQTATLYLEAHITWHGRDYYHETPQAAFAELDAWMRANQGGNFLANLRPGRTWESREGEASGAWAFNKRVPWVADAFWGPGGPQPGQKYGVATLGLAWLCPEGSQSTYYRDMTAVRMWFFCPIAVPLDPLISEASTCTASSPGFGNPIFPVAAIKTQREREVFNSSLSVARVYRSDTGYFEVEGSNTSVIRRLPQDPFADTSLIHDGTTCVVMRDVYPATRPYRCYPIVGYQSSDPNGTAILKLAGEGYREVPVAATPTRRPALSREVWSAGGGYRVLSSSNELSVFDSMGTLQSVLKPDGRSMRFTYLVTANPWDRRFVQAASDELGRSIQYHYNDQGLLSRLVGIDTRSTDFFYDEAPFACAAGVCGALTSVRFPDDTVRRYRYNESEHSLNPGGRRLLTGVIDELGNRTGTYKYDAQWRPYFTERTAGVDRWQVDYSAVNRRTVTPPVGGAITMRTASQSGSQLLLGLDQPAGSGCGPSSSAITYDAQANVSSRTDFNSNKICYAYDLSRNLQTMRVEGLSSSAVCATALSTPPAGARVISTQWHPDWRLETRIAEPKKLTTITYNGQGATCAPSTVLVDGKPPAVICSRTEQATTDESGAAGFSATVTGTARTWRYTYTTYGRVLTATDPNNRTTTYTYHADNDPDLGKRGNVATITNAANHVTHITDYNPHGQPTRIADPNGVVTVLTYDPRMRLTSHTQGSEATIYRYDPRGLLEQVTLPDGARLTYTHDAAHRLTAIADHKGNRIDYTLDAMGNRTAEQTRDPGGVLVGNIARVIDALNRVERSTGAIQ